MAKDNILNQTIAAMPIVLAVIDRELAIEERKLAELQRAATRSARGGRLRLAFGNGSKEAPEMTVAEEEASPSQTQAAGTASGSEGPTPPVTDVIPHSSVPPQSVADTNGANRAAANGSQSTVSPAGHDLTPPAPSSLAARFGFADPPASAASSAAASSATDSAVPDSTPSGGTAATFQSGGSESQRALADGLAVYETELPGRFAAPAVQDAQRFQAEDPDALPRALVAAHEEGVLPPELAEVVADLRAEEGRFQAAEAWLDLTHEEEV